MNMVPGQSAPFVFVCPETGETFESADFSVVDYAGVVTGEDGRKTLDATVALNTPCPACGRRHAYHAGELLCPFTVGDAKKG